MSGDAELYCGRINRKSAKKVLAFINRLETEDTVDFYVSHSIIDID